MPNSSAIGGTKAAFLDLLFRKGFYDQDVLRLINPDAYLREYSTHQVATPSPSSWGEEGYWKVWLNEKNEWIYPHVQIAQERMTELACKFPNRHRTCQAGPAASRPGTLLAQASDWPFILRTGTSPGYASQRVKDHLLRFHALHEQLTATRIDEPGLAGQDRMARQPLSRNPLPILGAVALCQTRTEFRITRLGPSAEESFAPFARRGWSRGGSRLKINIITRSLPPEARSLVHVSGKLPSLHRRSGSATEGGRLGGLFPTSQRRQSRDPARPGTADKALAQTPRPRNRRADPGGQHRPGLRRAGARLQLQARIAPATPRHGLSRAAPGKAVVVLNKADTCATRSKSG